MKNANIRQIPDHVAIEFDHGFEVVPTIVNGKAIRYATIDDDGAVVAWAGTTPPELDNGAWCRHDGDEDLIQAGMVGEDDGSAYQFAAGSLRRISVDAMLA